MKLLAISGSTRAASTNTTLLRWLADAVIISSAEYVRSIPGGLKNAIDWLVSREELIDKPMFIAHASHRGDDMLASLRTVLSTVSPRFDESIFLKVPLSGKSTEAIDALLADQEQVQLAQEFLECVSRVVHLLDQSNDTAIL